MDNFIKSISKAKNTAIRKANVDKVEGVEAEKKPEVRTKKYFFPQQGQHPALSIMAKNIAEAHKKYQDSL